MTGLLLLPSVVLVFSSLPCCVEPLECSQFSVGNAELRVLAGSAGLSLWAESRTAILNGTLGMHAGTTQTCPAVIQTDDKTSITWNGYSSLEVSHYYDEQSDCYTVDWHVLKNVAQEIQDCYQMSKAHWYGGAEDRNQFWPIEQLSNKLSPYIPNEALHSTYGEVIERYFFNSHGFGIYINPEVPLYVSINSTGDRLLCFVAKTGQFPYIRYGQMPTLKYTVCRKNSVRAIHMYMMKKFFRKPTNIPNTEIFRYPIWSTWAKFKKSITQKKVIQYANDIITHGFSCSQLEIDDGWMPKYGDLVFNNRKFPNPEKMIKILNNRHIFVTLWIHPFVNVNSESFQNNTVKNYLMKDSRTHQPALISWWNGKKAGVLNVTNEEAIAWFLNKLNQLKQLGVTSFKFDAGELNYIPPVHNLNESCLPEMYPTLYATLAYEADRINRRQEVRVGSNTQHLPMFVRMDDRYSTWNGELSLSTLIPTALTFGLLGYPFVLPDYIGGNAYAEGSPDQELFVRWLQVTLFMPSMQFSIPPWMYGEEVIHVTRKMLVLREKFASTLIKLAKNAVQTGEPILRPLWWIAPWDSTALQIDSEFLVGDDILVAPVLEKNAMSRSVYLPKGKWRAMFAGSSRGIVDGGYWMCVEVKLETLPFYMKIS